MPPPQTQLLRAAFVAPMDGPFIRDGCLAIFGDRIEAVGPCDQMLGWSGAAPMEDLGDVVLLPGLINAHTHLEFSSVACGDSVGGTFTDWILSLRDRARFDPDNMEPNVTEATRAGIAQCLRFGVTCVGDISQQSQFTRPVLHDSPLRAVSFGEILGLAKLRWRFEQLMQLALRDEHVSDRLHIGLTPHAPYTVDLPGYRRSLEIARERDLPLATHLAETRDEKVFLESHAGPFREVWDTIGMWAEPVETFRGSPIEFARAVGLLDEPTLLAHVNYCDDAELAILSRGRASVVYCPRTHRYFGHAPHRWREMLAAGINVAVGTDSCASSPDLNLVDELRLLHEIAPEKPVDALWEMATIRAAHALKMDRSLGSITHGKCADLVAFPAVDNDPLRHILESRDLLPTRVWIGGEAVVAGRRSGHSP
jgi:cytosine/adenosine deaminase-related metal-dependent hydrolase